VDRLLRTLQADRTPLGRRDYAFILLRLRTGVPFRRLQQLKWGQIEHDQSGALVRWREEAESQPLAEEVWETIRAALEEGGRLERMQADDFVFAPMVNPGKPGAGKKAEDWQGRKYQQNNDINHCLKLYGRSAGIAEEKLSMTAMRWTAVRLRMEQGASLEEMKAFMDSRSATKTIKFNLGQLPSLPASEPQVGGHPHSDQVRVPDRKGKQFQPGEGLKHGLYAHSQPQVALAAVMAEDIQGVEEQISGLRTLGRRLLERQTQASDSREAAQLAEAYSLAASRLGELIKAERQLAIRGKSSQWAEEVLEMLDRAARAEGEGPIAERIQTEARQTSFSLEADPATSPGEPLSRTREEIAGLRYVLRKVFELALPGRARQAVETGELVRLVEV
jgi:Phage integrase family